MNNNSQKSKDKYLKEKVDSFILRVPKGDKEKIQERAGALGKSLNAYVVDLIKADIPSLGAPSKPVEPPKSEETPKPRRKSSLPSFLD